MADLVSPNACRYCDVDADVHLQRWAADVGWHRWTVPTDEQRKTRMLARREEVSR